MTPTYKLFNEDERFPMLTVPQGKTANELVQSLMLKDTVKSSDLYPRGLGHNVFIGKGVAWNGHLFEVVALRAETYNDQPKIEFMLHDEEHEWWSKIYYPIDQRLSERDCDGATLAVANSDNNAWLFLHCDQDYMRDREMELRSAIITLFQPYVDKLTMAVLATPAKRPTNAPIGVPWESQLSKRVKLDNLTTIREQIIACALKHVRELHIGAYHQAPHGSHIFERVRTCIAKAAFIHKFTQSAAYASVSGEMSAIIAEVSNPHDYETRWDKAARVKAEAAANE